MGVVDVIAWLQQLSRSLRLPRAPLGVFFGFWPGFEAWSCTVGGLALWNFSLDWRHSHLRLPRSCTWAALRRG